MIQWHATPPADWIPDNRILLTATSSSECTTRFAKVLREQQIHIVDILDWEDFCRSLLDPEDFRWERSQAACLALLRFEDWDHFSDHLRDRSIQPSYQLVRRKTGELIQGLTSAANRTDTRFGVLVQWSEQAKCCQEVNQFFEQVTEHLKRSLESYPNIFVQRQFAPAPAFRTRITGPPEVS